MRVARVVASRRSLRIWYSSSGNPGVASIRASMIEPPFFPSTMLLSDASLFCGLLGELSGHMINAIHHQGMDMVESQSESFVRLAATDRHAQILCQNIRGLGRPNHCQTVPHGTV